MTVSSKVIVLDPDARSGRQLRLGFEREGVPTYAMDPDKPEITEVPDLVVVGGVDGQGIELVRKARALLEIGGFDAPIVFAGSHARPTEIEAAGADEVVLRPAFLRDVVTIGRILRGKTVVHRANIVGSLAETTGVFNLVRALSALGRSAVLTLIRGLRRGEVRFYHGEVTSAQVGLIHGQAALHQLLLWTDARFDFHHEDVVRRQQIPLAPEELFADAERFLAGVRDESGRLSPSMVLEQDVARIHSLGKQIPTEVHGVLRMFDGHRVLADILEDSPYRVFETLRVTQRAVEAGLLRPSDTQRARASWRVVLAIEEWLVGSETREAVVERTAAIEAEGAKEPPKLKGSRRSRKRKRINTPISLQAPKMDIDWGALVPRVVGAEVGPLAGVVPAAQASGEIPSRDAPRERLEGVMDTQAREKVFGTDVSSEPKIIFDEAEEIRLGEVQRREKRDAAEKVAAPESADTIAVEKLSSDVAAAGKDAAAKTADKATADKADADRLAAEVAAAGKAAAEKLAASIAAADKLALERAAAGKAAADKIVADKLAAETAAADKLAAEKAAAEKRAAETLAAEKAAEKLAAEQAAAEKLAADKLAAEQAAADKLAAEQAAADKLAAEQAAADKLAADKLAADKLAAETAAAEKAAADKLAADKLAAETAAAEKAAADKLAADKLAADKLAAEKAAAEKAAAEKAAADKAAAEKAAADKAAADRAAADKAAADKAAADKAAAAQLAAVRAAADKIAGEKLIAAERAAAERAVAQAELLAARAKHDAEADTKAKVEAKERRVRAEARAKSEADKEDAATWAKVEADARARAEAEERARAAEADRMAAEAALAKAEALAHAAEEARRAAEAAVWAKAEAEARAKAEADERTERLRREALERQDAGDRARVDAESWSTAFAKAEEALDDSAHVAAVMAIGDSVTTTPFVRPDPIAINTPAVTVAETPAARVTVHDALEVQHRRDVAHVTATPVATVTEGGAPESIDDAPSDGVVRQMTTAETAPVRRAPPGHIPEDDRPKDTGGEIAPRAVHQPVVDAGPSILIDDLAAAQAAISSVITQAARTQDASTPAATQAVADVRKDAVAFTADEQAFFKQHETGAVPRQSLEEIDDDPYEKRTGFWDRLLKRKPPKK